MKRFLRLFAVAAVMVLMLVSCTGGRVIPRGKMAKIYAEMLLRDQWVILHSSNQRMADTSLVYKDILVRYGYSEQDYRKSVNHYIQDSERYARILKKSADILEKRHKKLISLKQQLDSLVQEKHVYNMAPRGLKQLSNPKDRDNCRVNDAIFFVDSIPSWDWHIDPSRGWDTLWRGPLLDIDTTLVVKDTTLCATDTTAVCSASTK